MKTQLISLLLKSDGPMKRSHVYVSGGRNKALHSPVVTTYRLLINHYLHCHPMLQNLFVKLTLLFGGQFR